MSILGYSCTVQVALSQDVTWTVPIQAGRCLVSVTGRKYGKVRNRLVKTSFSKWQFGFSHVAEPNLKMGEGSGECATLAWVREKELKIQVNINASNRNAETSEDRCHKPLT